MLFKLLTVCFTVILSATHQEKYQKQFDWLEETQPHDPINYLAKDSKWDDIYYIFTGDTQIGWKCDTKDRNKICHWPYNKCMADKNDDKECGIEAVKAANNAQFQSIGQLASEIRSFHHQRVDGLIINGDLTDYGHSAELSYFEDLWVDCKFDKDKFKFHDLRDVIKETYFGLGNHDYANNVHTGGDSGCYAWWIKAQDDSCAIRMFKFMKEMYQNTRYKIDLETSEKGSLAYQWQTCRKYPRDSVTEKCIAFVQLHNYPWYERTLTNIGPFGIKTYYEITSSLKYLEKFLKENINHPVVINFHIIEDLDKDEFIEILSQHNDIIGIFGAHMHSLAGTCSKRITVNNRSIPVYYSGSVPANQYMLAKFNLHTGDRKFYVLRVDENGKTEMSTDASKCWEN